MVTEVIRKLLQYPERAVKAAGAQGSGLTGRPIGFAVGVGAGCESRDSGMMPKI